MLIIRLLYVEGKAHLSGVNWIDKLIALYLYISEVYDSKLCLHCQRMSNNSEPKFTDAELLTVYCFGIMQGRFALKEIHRYCEDHLSDWFPDLPSYQAFNARLNRMTTVFPALIEDVLRIGEKTGVDFDISVLDSAPIVVANGQRSQVARVATEFCNKAKCSSKQMYYYGAKLHLLGFRRMGTLPYPEYIGLTPASHHDLTTFRAIAPLIANRRIFADKIYIDQELIARMENEQNASILTPVKKRRGQQELEAWAKLFSTAVSKVRQPIESLFNWIEERTHFQKASKVRSFEGLQIHVFGRLAAACMMLVLPAFYP